MGIQTWYDLVNSSQFLALGEKVANFTWSYIGIFVQLLPYFLILSFVLWLWNWLLKKITSFWFFDLFWSKAISWMQLFWKTDEDWYIQEYKEYLKTQKNLSKKNKFARKAQRRDEARKDDDYSMENFNWWGFSPKPFS